MTFVSLPNSGQTLRATRAQIKNNMDSLRTQAAVNHYDVDAVNAGKHICSNYVDQATPPTVAANELAVFNKLVSSVPYLFTVNAAAVQNPLTGPFTAATPGQATLYGGIQLRWGIFTGVSNSPPSAWSGTFSPQFTTGCFGAVLTKTTDGSDVPCVTAVSATTISGTRLQSGVTAFYLAIGY